MDSREILHQTAHHWVDAFNEKNIEKLLALYDDQAYHFSPKLKIKHPETNGMIIGKKAMRDWWQDAFDRLPDLQYIINHIVAEENIIYIEYIRKATGEEDSVINERFIVKNKLIINSKVLQN